MAINGCKGAHMRTPVENHATAAWADREDLKELSNVNIPDEDLVAKAKEYVDSNHK